MNTIDCELLKNCVLIRLKTPSWGNTRKLDVCKKAVEAIMDDGDASTVVPSEEFEEARKARLEKMQKRVKGSKTLIEAGEYDALVKYLTGRRVEMLSRYVVPSFLDDGLYAVRIESLPGLEREIEETKKRMETVLIPALCGVYPDKVREAQELWNGSFRAKEYPGVVQREDGSLDINPDALMGRFRIEFAYWQVSVPEGLPPEVREREEAKLRESFAKAEAKITDLLYSSFKDLIDRLVDRLTPGPDGAKKQFQYSTFENLSEFIGSFVNKNVFNDGRLAELVKRADEIMDSVGGTSKEIASTVRDYDSIRERTAEKFTALKEAVDRAVTEMPKRAFDFEE